MFFSDEGSTLETLDYTIRIGSTPTFLYADFNHYSVLRRHSLNLNNLKFHSLMNVKFQIQTCEIASFWKWKRQPSLLKLFSLKIKININ